MCVHCTLGLVAPDASIDTLSPTFNPMVAMVTVVSSATEESVGDWEEGVERGPGGEWEWLDIVAVGEWETV